MQQSKQEMTIPTLEKILDSNPLTFLPETLVSDVIAAMNQMPESGYALVLSQERLLGIFTEQDVVKLAASQMLCSTISIGKVMTQPVLTLTKAQCPNILAVWSFMQKHSLRYLPILSEHQKLLGVISLDSLLQSIDPKNLASLVVKPHLNGNTEVKSTQGIKPTDQHEIINQLEHQDRQTQLLAEVTLKIRMSIELEEILQTTVTEVQNLLACDRVMIVELKTNHTAIPISEAILPNLPPMLGYELADPLLVGEDLTRYRQGKIRSISDLQTATIDTSIKQLLQQFAVKAKLVVPILSQDKLQGLLVAHQCDHPRQWQDSEITLLQRLADQIGVAISQAQLLNNLEELVSERTTELIVTNQKLQTEILERQQTENSLRENKQKLAGILDNADEGIISIDEQQIIQLFNQGAEKIFGYRADEVIGKPLDILLPKVFHQVHRQHVENFANSINISQNMAERSSCVYGRRKYGEEFPAEASISKLRSQNGMLFTVMLKDITERQQAAEKLQSSQALLAKAEQIAQMGSWEYNLLTKQLSWSEELFHIWGFTPSKSIPSCAEIFNCIHPDDWKLVRDTLRQGHREGKSWQITYRLLRTDGLLRYVESRGEPTFNQQKQVLKVWGTIMDITERKAIEQMKSEFVSVASHEMRTPLTSIHGALQLLCANRLGDLSSSGHKMAQIALKNTDRLIRLLNDVLDLERMESGRETLERQNCRSDELIQQAVDTMTAIAQAQQITIETNANSIPLRIDRDRILQTLTNLLSNAIKFSPDHSQIWVTSQLQDEQVLFTVKDRGRGIPADKIDMIFERFQQVDASDSRKKGGTGLGLAICRHIIQQHGGEIWVESIFGQGSTFFFTIPK